jgi:hypothetical protein
MPVEACESSLHTVLSVPDLELSNNFLVTDPGLLFTLARARLGWWVCGSRGGEEGRGGTRKTCLFLFVGVLPLISDQFVFAF